MLAIKKTIILMTLGVTYADEGVNAISTLYNSIRQNPTISLSEIKILQSEARTAISLDQAALQIGAPNLIMPSNIGSPATTQDFFKQQSAKITQDLTQIWTEGAKNPSKAPQKKLPPAPPARRGTYPVQNEHAPETIVNGNGFAKEIEFKGPKKGLLDTMPMATKKKRVKPRMHLRDLAKPQAEDASQSQLSK